jgi:hypothetical protein
MRFIRRWKTFSHEHPDRLYEQDRHLCLSPPFLEKRKAELQYRNFFQSVFIQTRNTIRPGRTWKQTESVASVPAQVRVLDPSCHMPLQILSIWPPTPWRSAGCLSPPVGSFLWIWPTSADTCCTPEVRTFVEAKCRPGVSCTRWWPCTCYRTLRLSCGGIRSQAILIVVLRFPRIPYRRGSGSCSVSRHA